MAYPIPMIQPATGRRAVAYSGISWTCLFFGPLPALCRRHLFGFIGMTLVNFATFGLSTLVFIFVYNAWHYHSLVGRGFMPAGHDFGEVSHNVVMMRAEGANDYEDYHDSAGEQAFRRRISLATPEQSDRLIDDYGRGSSWKK